MKKWFVYFLQCKDLALYCGITNNLEKRVKTHNEGKGAKYTRVRLPVTLIWFTTVDSKSEALKLEAKLKKLKRNDKLKLINGN